MFLLKAHVMLGGHVFNTQSIFDVSPHLADMLLYSHNAEIMQRLFMKTKKKPVCYIDDAVSLNNASLSDYIVRNYLIEFDIKDYIYINV